jgi:hypothetical protein
MALELTQATQFSIKKLVIISKLGNIDIQNIFQELNIFDSILIPCISGNVLIADSLGLSSKLLFDGSEYLDVDISKSNETGFTNIQKRFRIYKQSDRTNSNQNSELYVLHFVSDEMVYSEQQKINQSYTGTYSQIALSVLQDYLKVNLNKVNVEKTEGIHSVVIPLLSPIDTMNWLTRRSVGRDKLADFIFFENKFGFNFKSLSTIYQTAPTLNIKFQPKNLVPELQDEFLGVTDFKFSSTFDILENIKNGYYSNRFIGFDILTRTLVQTDLGLLNNYKGAHLNKTPNVFSSPNREGKDPGQMPFSKVSLYPFQYFRTTQAYTKQNDPSTANLIDNTHTYIPQRKAILNNLLQRRVTINLPGNFGISSGFILNLEVQNYSLHTDGGDKDKTDKSLSGKYLVIGARHIIRPSKHETVCELVADSRDSGFVASNNLNVSK